MKNGVAYDGAASTAEENGSPERPGALSLFFYRALRIAIGGVFLYAGSGKILELKAFSVSICSYGLLPDSLCIYAAVFFCLVEIAAGAGLMADRRGSLSVITGLLAVFSIVLWFGVLNDLNVDCGCFSASEQAEHHDLRMALYRDLMMMAGAFSLYVWRSFYKLRRMM
ncbi:MAG: DoxX family membrane protein [Deltaproteobacteria bacterium]|nr:DoxX family membrane protein [Deltaproteobacteria bacterium]